MATELPLLKPEGRVLTTLESDGSRRWLYPRLARGRFWSARRVVAYGLIALYAVLPFIKLNGHPAMQIDLVGGRIHLLGATFLPTDAVILALLMVMLLLSILLATALAGRVWCGWGCPQTVYLEFVFRPLERFFTGTTGRGGPAKGVAPWRVGLMYATYFVICLHLSNVFLAYFVGVDNLHRWIWSGTPWRHPGAFTLVMVVTLLMMFDFAYWREQLCIIGCPYGRFQSVTLDRWSAIIGYDPQRGEPRAKGRRDGPADSSPSGRGDCVDCSMCVSVCPTGIDIRDGLQLECVACAQCIDACDAVMDKVGLPRGLIRYSSQAALAGATPRVLRTRVLLYGLLLTVLATAFVTLLATRSPLDVAPLRSLGRPYVVTASGDIDNTLRIKITNRTRDPQTYRVEAVAPGSLRLLEPVETDAVAPGESTTVPAHLLAPAEAFHLGLLDARFRVTDGQHSVERRFRLMGPARNAGPAHPPTPPGSP